jgi:class 3 adenylate cyclase
VREAAGDAYRWSSAGARSLKGVDGPVRLYRVRRARREDQDAQAA